MKKKSKPTKEELEQFHAAMLAALPQLDTRALSMWRQSPLRLKRQLREMLEKPGVVSKTDIRLRVDYVEPVSFLLEAAGFVSIHEDFKLEQYRVSGSGIKELDIWCVCISDATDDEIWEAYKAHNLRPLTIIEFLTLAKRLPAQPPEGFESLMAFGMKPAPSDVCWNNIWYMDDDAVDEGIPQGKTLGLDQAAGELCLAVINE